MSTIMETIVDTRPLLSEVAKGIVAGELIPFLGPDLLEANDDEDCPVPASTRALVDRLTQTVGVPGRIRNNLWSSAQYIETHRHRVTLTRMMADIFKPVPKPGALHSWLATLTSVPLVVDTWYDATLTSAFSAAGRTDWGQVQGVTRNGETRDIYFRAFAADGSEVEPSDSAGWATTIYKPHGSVWPATNFLVSDSDYVEALTEIDIQTPIPARVQDLRSSRGFAFLGCRFYDQMLRTYARQIIKRSKGPHYAVLPEDITRNEAKFLAEMDIVPIHLPLDRAVQVMLDK